MTPFQTGKDISSCDELFGRDSQIKALTKIAERHENAGIIGARRFGKTCLLKSMLTRIVDMNIDALPIYFDAKASGIEKDTDMVFRRLSSLVLSEICAKGLIKSGKLKLWRNVSIKISEERIAIEEQLSEFSSERQRDALTQACDIVFQQGRYVLFLFDEIDYLLLKAFESPNDFGRIRGLASEGDTLKFWVAGTASWSYMCTKIGSAELNCGLSSINLPPLEKTCFKDLWNYECDKISDLSIQAFVRGKLEQAYVASGGVPFYAKVIGQTLCLNDGETKLDYIILRDYLKELLENQFFSERDRELLTKLSIKPQSFDDTAPDELQSLVSRGLVNINETGQYCVPIGYLRDYLLSTAKNGTETDIEEPIIQSEGNARQSEWSPKEMVRDIMSLRKRINQIWNEENLYNKILISGTYAPFEPSLDDPEDIRVLEQKCSNTREYTAFGGSIYHIFYEGTHKGLNLPPNFAPFIRRGKFKNGITDQVSEFAQIAKVCRHAVGGHRDYVRENPDDISVETLLLKINNGNVIKDSDCAVVQKRILEMCLKYMNDMLEYLQSLV